MSSQNKTRLAYRFFQQKCASRDYFTVTDLMQATGWTKITVETYISKQFHDLLFFQPDRKIQVRPEFQRIDEETFLQIATQKRKIFTEYQRLKYSEVVTYEFLLPLTREEQLHLALDDLFFEDAVQQRLYEIGLDRVKEWIPVVGMEQEAEYVHRVCQVVSDKFGGYSISHVSGRYRASALASRAQAAEMFANGKRYIIDETTASVRFIIPIEATRTTDLHGADQAISYSAKPGKKVVREIDLVRSLFFNLFVEAIVRMVKGEDVIWLVEETGFNRSLYVWQRS
jgi:hypothetical protein